MTVVTPEYWPPISHVAQWYNSPAVCLQTSGTYQKQSFLNRCKIAGVQGVLTLSVPLVGGREQKNLYGDVLIDNSQRWAVQHLRTLQSCYGKAPFFDYYFPIVEKLLLQRVDQLAELNAALLQQLIRWLKWEGSVSETLEFRKAEFSTPIVLPPYVQVFSDRLPFLPDLSILDLFFCLGPACARYLQQIDRHPDQAKLH